MSNVSSPNLRPRNRFARYPKTTRCVTVLVLLAAIELGSYLLIVFKGHRDLRFQYRYNRILSGYTVFQNVPNHSFRTSAIKSDPADPDPVLDRYGFLSDGEVRREKQKGTYRIFLVGGSTAFGAGQNVRYHSAHSYPDGLYAYPSSLAGRLKTVLERRKPGTRYEVINAAGFERRIHQSFIQYLQTLSRFEPDLIISFEGMNDVDSLVTGTPFEDVEEQLPFYVDLYRQPHSPLNYSATYYVLSTAFEKWRNRRRSAGSIPESGAAPSRTGTKTGRSSGEGDPGREQYEKSKDRYRRNADRLLQILRQYFAVLKNDGQRTMFVLQPLLHRRKKNKRLSDAERAFVSVLVPTAANSKTRLDEPALLLMYFYDDYLSPAIGETAGRFGVEYVDMNAEITDLGPDVEFYTDYCHLTPEGNGRVAEILGRRILEGKPPSKPR